MKSSRLVLISMLFFFHESHQSCQNVHSLQQSNITASMDKAIVFDKNYSNPQYAAMFGGDKAFCVTPKNDFHIQIDFKKLLTITNIRIQGFILNKKSLMMSAFSLMFSTDGKKWYTYVSNNDIPFIVTKYKSYTGDTKVNIELDNPVATQYLRFLPKEPGIEQNNADPICMRIQVTGCERVQPPKIITPSLVEMHLSETKRLTCQGIGTFGLDVKWTENQMANSFYPKNYKVDHKVKYALSFNMDDLKNELTCNVHDLFLNCTREYTCKGNYHFKQDVFAISKTLVSVIVKFPSQPSSFKIKSKFPGKVVLQWNATNLYQFPAEKLEYGLMCSRTNFTEVTLPLSTNTYILDNLDVYTSYTCSIKVQVKNESLAAFPFTFAQKPVVLKFNSSTIRPNVQPELKAKVMSPTEINVSFKVDFDRKEYGQIKGYIIKADMTEYANSPSSLRSFEREEVEITKRIDDPLSREYTLKGVVPWSKYKLTLYVINEDELKTNSVSKIIRMPEGVPSNGLSMAVERKAKTSLLLVNKFEKGLRLQHMNGNILKFMVHVSPINKTQYFTRGIVEVVGLSPNTEYVIRGKAATKVGYGPFGPALVVRTLEDRPTAPLHIDTFVIKNKKLGVTWNAPKHSNGNITAYMIKVELKNGTVLDFITPKNPHYYFEFDMDKSIVTKITVAAETSAGWGPDSKPYYPQDDPEDPESKSLNQVILIVALVFAIIFLIILIVLCALLNRRRSMTICVKPDTARQPIYPQDDSLPSPRLPEDDEEEYEQFVMWSRQRSDSVGTGSHISLLNSTHEPVPVDKFYQYMESLKEDEYGALMDEFKSVTSGKCSPWLCAERPENQNKNRYTNINAYDHSRVVLKTESRRKGQDYINASFVQGFNYEESSGPPYRYISAQGPLDYTKNDFWLMLWQEEATIIVMLTNLVENERLKCSQYWPNDSQHYGDLTVTLDKIDKTADYITRSFKIEKASTKETRNILQFHFVSWPDHGVPDYPTAILSLRRRVRHYYDPTKPMIVHCSAGVGRSGCFILLDAMLERIDKEKSVDVFNYLRYMRTRRVNMVQTFEQYRFAHTAILESITFGNTEIFVGELDKKIRQLGKNNGMADEFNLLMQNTTPVPATGNLYQVLLREGKFIDAYHVDGYKHRDAFIITKATTENNVADFWKMVLEKQCHTIVMLNKSVEQTQV
eukprot:TCONS_00015235-protein